MNAVKPLKARAKEKVNGKRVNGFKSMERKLNAQQTRAMNFFGVGNRMVQEEGLMKTPEKKIPKQEFPTTDFMKELRFQLA